MRTDERSKSRDKACFGYALRGEGSPKGNSDGNTNVRFHQKDTLKRFFEGFEQNKLIINRFILLTALIRNFYKFIMARLDVKRFGLKATSRIKAFVFKFISVPAKWVRTSRQYVLNIYSCNNAYADVFQNDFG